MSQTVQVFPALTGGPGLRVCPRRWSRHGMEHDHGNEQVNGASTQAAGDLSEG